jgi:hypothetical protein
MECACSVIFFFSYTSSPAMEQARFNLSFLFEKVSIAKISNPSSESF